MTAVFQAVSIIVVTMGFSAVFIAFLEDNYQASINRLENSADEMGGDSQA
jgi:hypothetical protein